MFLRSITDWLDDVGVQVFVLADQVPKVLPNDLEIARCRVGGSGLAIADAKRGLNPCCDSRLSDSNDSISQVLCELSVLRTVAPVWSRFDGDDVVNAGIDELQVYTLCRGFVASACLACNEYGQIFEEIAEELRAAATRARAMAAKGK